MFQILNIMQQNFPDKTSHAFKEVAIIRHPRLGEYAFGFITSTVILHKNTGGEELCCVYVPTNHLYLGDIFLVNSKDIMRPNLSVREGIGKTLNWKIYKLILQFSPSSLQVMLLCLTCKWCRNCHIRGHGCTKDTKQTYRKCNPFYLQELENLQFHKFDYS